MRLEDLDPDRCRPEFAAAMIEATAWLGLSWDDIIVQSERAADHARALDELAANNLLYPCACTRSDLRGGRRAPDGGWAYDNRCRGRGLPIGGWRASHQPIRMRLPDEHVTLIDDSGLDLSQTPAIEMGDPILRRRDGAMAYQLVVVVDDHRDGINRVVRGRDIAPSTATQILIARALGYPSPSYRHHLLLVEPANNTTKLAKLHGSVGFPQLAARYRGAELCGILTHGVGLTSDASPIHPEQLISSFDWAQVSVDDLVATWNGDLTIATLPQ